MSDDAFHEELRAFIQQYCDVVSQGLEERWNSVTLEIYRREVTDTIAALSARQATLAIEMARAPRTWTPHLAPLILRSMADAHITVAWILKDREERARQYVRFGLGQEKLFVEYLENEPKEARDREIDDRIQAMIDMRRSWLTSQLMEWAIEVNVGSWSGLSAREMAQQADCESLYKFAYTPFSGAVHNMWQHVGLFNSQPCTNPLHKGHRMPLVPDLPMDPDYLYRASKYVSRTFGLLETELGGKSSIPLPVDFMATHPLFASGWNGSGDV